MHAGVRVPLTGTQKDAGHEAGAVLFAAEHSHEIQGHRRLTRKLAAGRGRSPRGKSGGIDRFIQPVG